MHCLGSGGLNMGPMGHVPEGGGGRAETYFFRQRGLVEMVQYVAFPEGIGRTTSSHKTTLPCREGVMLAIYSKLALINNDLRSTTWHDDSVNYCEAKLERLC